MKKAVSNRSIRYDVWAFYTGGWNTDFEEKLDKLAPRNRTGSGTDLSSGERDHSWSFKGEKAANRLAARLRRFKRISRVSVEQVNENDD